MTGVYSLLQIITRVSTLLPVLSTWETCALNLIEKQSPSAVFFFCKSASQCPSNVFYTLIRVPSQSIFGLEINELPSFKESEMVFIPVHNDVFIWGNGTIQKYRFGGKNDFSLVIVVDMSVRFKKDMESLKLIYDAAWQSGVMKTFVILKNESSTLIFTYDPFKSENSCEDTSPVLIGSCTAGKSFDFRITYKVLNLNKCPLRISMINDRPWFNIFPLSGKLSNLVTEIAHRMNFTVVEITPSNGKKGGLCGPEEFTGGRGDVSSGKAHMAIGMYDRKECSVLMYTGIPIVDCLSWCTPILSGSNYIYLFIVKQLQPEVWFALIVTVFIVVISVVVLCSLTNDNISSTTATYLALVVFAQTPPLEFRSSPVRLIVTLWLFMCLVVRTAYEGELKSQSAVPLGAHIIEGLDELADLEIPLCAPLGALQILGYVDEPSIRKLYNKTKVCKGTTHDNLVHASKNKNIAVFIADLVCRVISSEINEEESTLFPTTGGCFKGHEFTLIVTLPGFPFNKRLTEIAHRCFEMGLVHKWMDLQPVRQNKGRVRPYSLHHLFPALFALGVGCLAGFIVFLAEVGYYKRICKVKLV